MKETDYDEDIRIDEMALDVEWLEQANLMRKYTQIAADTKRDAAAAKEYVDWVKASLDKDIRANPDSFGIDKINNDVVNATILLQQQYQDAATAYNDARYEQDVASGVVSAFEQRKTALENLVKLLGQSYFAGPVTPRDLSREYVERAERKHSNAKVSIKKRPRPDVVDEVIEDAPAPKALRRKKG